MIVKGLRKYVDDEEFISKWQEVKHDAKIKAMDFIEDITGVKIPKNAMLDMQVLPLINNKININY